MKVKFLFNFIIAISSLFLVTPGYGENARVSKFLEETVLPTVQLENTTLEEVLDFLTLRSIELDPKKEGVTFNLLGDFTKGDPAAEVKEFAIFVKSFAAKEMTFADFLKHITKGSEYTYSVEPLGVVLQHKDFKAKPTPDASKISPEVRAQLQAIVIPRMSLNNSSLEELNMFLSLRAAELAKDGVGFRVTKAAHWNEEWATIIPRFSASNAPLGDLLDFFAKSLGLDYEVSGRTVIFSPAAESEKE